MSRIFITGSSEGLGLMAGQLLAAEGHGVVLHARNPARAQDARRALPQVEAIVHGDVSTIAGARSVAEQVNALGRCDAVIHNVGIGYQEPQRVETIDGLPQVFAVNVMAPYLLTALIARPKRLVYLSSGMHHGVHAQLEDMLWRKRRWDGPDAYAESKLYDAMLAFAIARRWPDVCSNAVDPGWVPTRMGGPSAPDDMDQAHRTQVWLAVSDDPDAQVTGQYFHHRERRRSNPEARDPDLQDRLTRYCEELSGVSLPASGSVE